MTEVLWGLTIALLAFVAGRFSGIEEGIRRERASRIALLEEQHGGQV